MTFLTAPPKMKITFAQMRAQGARNVMVQCPGCGHRSRLCADRWADSLRLSDIEPRLICSVCRQIGSVLTPAAKIPVAVD